MSCAELGNEPRVVATVSGVSSWLLLILGGASAFATASALFRLRRPATNGFAVMLVSWWTGEYPIFHLVAQVLAVALLFDGVDRPIGYVGLGLFVASWVGLVVVRIVQRRARPSGEMALRAGLGDEYLAEIPADRRDGLRTRPELRLMLLPFHFSRAGSRSPVICVTARPNATSSTSIGRRPPHRRIERSPSSFRCTAAAG